MPGIPESGWIGMLMGFRSFAEAALAAMTRRAPSFWASVGSDGMWAASLNVGERLRDSTSESNIRVVVM